MSPLRLLLLHARNSSTSRSRPCWNPHTAFAAATERVHSGTLTPEDVHHLFDELLLQDTPVQERPLNNLLAALACAPASAACSNGPALAVALFSRMSQGTCRQVAQATVCTYSILMDCCCRARRLDFALAFFGRLLRTGLGVNQVVFNTLLKGICHTKRAEEALDVLLHRMPEVGCTPDTVAYNTVIHGYLKEGQTGKACNLFHEMVQQGVVPNVVTYNSVIHGYFKEGQVGKAYNLFHEMVQQGVVPNVVTYNSVIHGYFKEGQVGKACNLFHEMVQQGIAPDVVTYNSVIHGYFKENHVGKACNLFHEMVQQGVLPDVVTYNSVIDALCKAQAMDKAEAVLRILVDNGVEPNATTYGSLIHGYSSQGHWKEVVRVFKEMTNRNVTPDVYTYNVFMTAWKKQRSCNFF